MSRPQKTELFQHKVLDESKVSLECTYVATGNVNGLVWRYLSRISHLPQSLNTIQYATVHACKWGGKRPWINYF